MHRVPPAAPPDHLPDGIAAPGLGGICAVSEGPLLRSMNLHTGDSDSHWAPEVLGIWGAQLVFAAFGGLVRPQRVQRKEVPKEDRRSALGK